MENLLQKICLTLVGVFSIMNFSTYPQRSARNSAYVYVLFRSFAFADTLQLATTVVLN